MLTLPRLTTTHPAVCAVCGAPSPRAIGSRDFGDSCNDAFAGSRTFPHYGIDISYHRCAVCAFTFTTAFDAWAPGDYHDFIYNADYVRADPPFLHERPLRNAQILAGIFHHEKSKVRILDYCAGNGTLAAELARLGFACDSCDLFYGKPPEQRRYPVVTCFEAIEHVPHADQLAFFDGLMSHVEPGGALFMSTLLLSPDAPVDDDYICPRNGHVSIHADASLRRLAARHGLAMLSLNNQFHVLQRPPAALQGLDSAAQRCARGETVTARSDPAGLIIGHGNSIHDPAIAVAAGDALFAEAFERHVQNKRALCSFGLFYSSRAIQAALRDLGVDASAIRHIALRSSWEHAPADLQAMRAAITADRSALEGFLPPGAAATAMDTTSEIQLPWIVRGRRPGLHRPREAAPVASGVDVLLKPVMRLADPPEVRAAAVPHHLAHAAHAVYTSPFEECVAMILDGAGDRDSTTAYHFRANRFEVLATSPPEDSLGVLYAAVTQLCGFDLWEGEEWKVMGMAAYGRPRPEIQDFFRARTRIDGLRVKLDFSPSWPEELEAITGPSRLPGGPDVLQSADLAHNFQEYFSEVVCRLAAAASSLGLSKNLALAGGCALNSAANGRILRSSGFTRLHVPSAPADDGNALGCVLYEKHAVRDEPRLPAPLTPYLGTAVDIPELERILAFRGLPFRKLEAPDELAAEVAAMLAAGEIIGWMQGRAEFGPRALGNRSILADPRAPTMKDAINGRVKFREEYRPLAPAILHEHGPEYFDPYEESPYMERALPFRPEVMSRVPAVVHVDGTGRLQSVKRGMNPLFHRLLSAFHERTGVPILVNTSLNVMGKPIVHSVADALTVFVTTGLDRMVIGPYVLSKRG